MKRVTHKRAAELLARVTGDQAAEIGNLAPTGITYALCSRRDAEHPYYGRMVELGFSEAEADELLRYMRY